jgi:prolyl-tRNA synthetase
VQVAAPDPIPYADLPASHVEDTPDTPTIETLVTHLNSAFPREDRAWAAGDTLKNVVVMLVHPDGSRAPLVIGIPGDRDVDEKRLGAQVEPAVVAAFEEADFAAYPSLKKGYIGPEVLGEASESGIRYLVDPRVVDGTCVGDRRQPTGAPRARPRGGPGLHGRRDDRGRRRAPGDACPSCGHALESARGIEMGHIFQLGRKYAEALDLKVLDEHGKLTDRRHGQLWRGRLARRRLHRRGQP